MPDPLCVWPGVLIWPATGPGSTANAEVRPGHASWAQIRNKRNYQRERGQWHIKHLLSSYSPWFYLLLQIRTLLKRRERFCRQYGFKSWRRGSAIPSLWTSSQHLLPNQRDVVNRINSFNEDGMKRIFSSRSTRANHWERQHAPSSWARAHPLRAQRMRGREYIVAQLKAERVAGHPSSSGKVAGQLASFRLGADVCAHTRTSSISCN